MPDGRTTAAAAVDKYDAVTCTSTPYAVVPADVGCVPMTAGAYVLTVCVAAIQLTTMDCGVDMYSPMGDADCTTETEDGGAT